MLEFQQPTLRSELVGHTLNISLENRLRSLPPQFCEILFSSYSPKHGRAHEFCTSLEDLPQTVLQPSSEKAQVMTMPGEGYKFGTGKVWRYLCHKKHYIKSASPSAHLNPLLLWWGAALVPPWSSCPSTGWKGDLVAHSQEQSPSPL